MYRMILHFVAKILEQTGMLNHLLREEGYELPWPFKQSAKWFSSGGSSILAFTKDDSFNSIAG
jgi:hypothetical protein